MGRTKDVLEGCDNDSLCVDSPAADFGGGADIDLKSSRVACFEDAEHAHCQPLIEHVDSVVM